MFYQIYLPSNLRRTLEAFCLQPPTQTLDNHIREILTIVKVLKCEKWYRTYINKPNLTQDIIIIKGENDLIRGDSLSSSHNFTQSLSHSGFYQIFLPSNPRITLDAFGLQAPTQTFDRHIIEILTIVKVQKNVKNNIGHDKISHT